MNARLPVAGVCFIGPQALPGDRGMNLNQAMRGLPGDPGAEVNAVVELLHTEGRFCVGAQHFLCLLCLQAQLQAHAPGLRRPEQLLCCPKLA